jgi:hypothetical protein
MLTVRALKVVTLIGVAAVIIALTWFLRGQ